MWKIIILIFICFGVGISYSQMLIGDFKKEKYFDVKFENMEGILYKYYPSQIQDKDAFSILQNFEISFKKINNGYSDYYRIYTITTANAIRFVVDNSKYSPYDKSKKDQILLLTYLIPKNLISQEDKIKNKYFVYADKRVLRVKYVPANNNLSKVSPGIIMPESFLEPRVDYVK